MRNAIIPSSHWLQVLQILQIHPGFIATSMEVSLCGINNRAILAAVGIGNVFLTGIHWEPGQNTCTLT